MNKKEKEAAAAPSAYRCPNCKAQISWIEKEMYAAHRCWSCNQLAYANFKPFFPKGG